MKWEENVRKVVPYVAGEQPNRPNMIKLNTNECPYPPAPGVRKAAENMESAALRLYPNSNAQPLVDELAAYYGVKPEQVFVGVGSEAILSSRITEYVFLFFSSKIAVKGVLKRSSRTNQLSEV